MTDKDRMKLSVTFQTLQNKQSIVNGSDDQSVCITARRHPFRSERISINLSAGGSIADMISAIGLNTEFPVRVILDDRVILAQEYLRVFPKPGQILSIRVIPAGGGNSNDSEILTIAIAAVATAAGALIGNPQLGLLATETSLFAPATTSAAGGLLAANTLPGALALAGIQGAIASSINFLGARLINALIPPPKTPVPKQETTPHSYTVSGTANAAEPFSPIPKLYGRRRIFPQYAASPYNELVGFNQYLRMLFLLGYGPLDISQIKIGDTALEDYEDVEWELRAGFADDAPTRLDQCSVLRNEVDNPPNCQLRHRDWRLSNGIKEVTNYPRLRRSLFHLQLLLSVRILQPKPCIPASRSFPVYRTRTETPCSCGYNRFAVASRTRPDWRQWRCTSADDRYQRPLVAFAIKTERTQRALQVR